MGVVIATDMVNALALNNASGVRNNASVAPATTDGVTAATIGAKKFMNASALPEGRLEAELLIRQGWRSGPGGLARVQHRQPRRPGCPVVAPEVGGQLGMDRQLAQLAPAHVNPLRRGAMAAASAAWALTHSQIILVSQGMDARHQTEAGKPNLSSCFGIAASLNKIAK